jgi:hypothetical protein
LNSPKLFIEDDSIFGNKKEHLDYRSNSAVRFGNTGCKRSKYHSSAEKGNTDRKIIELLAAAGFREIVLPFESANQRIIDSYASKNGI